MTKHEFIYYISHNNNGFFKTRKSHIIKIAPEIFDEIINHNKLYNLKPIKFSDSLNYYINDIKQTNVCKICNITIFASSVYCSDLCRKKDVNSILEKAKKTLFNKNGATSPLGSVISKEKRKNTCQKKYGSDHSSNNLLIKEKIKRSNILAWKNEKLRADLSDKLIKTNFDNKDRIIDKRKQTNFIKNGEYTVLTSVSLNKIRKTLKKKYNTDNPFYIHSDTYSKAKIGSIEFFKDPINVKISQEKKLDTIVKNYGSLDKMYESLFNKSKLRIIKNLEDSIEDTISKYDYDNPGNVSCIGSDCQHEYDISMHLLRNRSYNNIKCCTICNPAYFNGGSYAETELYEWLSTFVECKRHDRKILGGLEIDIYIPSKKIAIEFNGVYWHSDLYKDKLYHINKTKSLKEIDIDLIHIWEDIWHEKKDIIKNRILSKLNIGQLKIGARECYIADISNNDANIFFLNNHLQGKTKPFRCISLKKNDEIISCIAIGKRSIGKNKANNYEILRMCSKIGYNVPGGFSKIFAYIKEIYPYDYISYADLSWGDGMVNKHAGFILNGYSKPNYWYIVNGKRFHRYTYRKSELVKMGYDKNKTEFQIMNEDIKSLRIYDCGNAVWTYKNLNHG